MAAALVFFLGSSSAKGTVPSSRFIPSLQTSPLGFRLPFTSFIRFVVGERSFLRGKGLLDESFPAPRPTCRCSSLLAFPCGTPADRTLFFFYRHRFSPPKPHPCGALTPPPKRPLTHPTLLTVRAWRICLIEVFQLSFVQRVARFSFPCWANQFRFPHPPLTLPWVPRLPWKALLFRRPRSPPKNVCAP